jgi:hypothetical protein
MVENDFPLAPPTIPAGALAIEKLFQSVENLRAELSAQGAVNNLKLTSVLDAITRFDQSLKLLMHEHHALKRDVVEMKERINNLEASAFRTKVKSGARKRRTR